MRVELKEDKIIDILMHAATRDDIARSNKMIWIILGSILMPILIYILQTFNK